MKIISKSCLALVITLTIMVCAVMPGSLTAFAAGEVHSAAGEIQTANTAADKAFQESLDMPYETVAYRDIPAASDTGSWALINLIVSALTVIGAGLALLRRQQNNHASSDDIGRRRRVTAGKTVGIVAAAVSVAVFVFTEDMSLRIGHVDRWTIVMIIILAVQAVSAAFVSSECRETEENTDNEECYQIR